jgi:ArsR family transcriptional regulator
MEKLGRLFQALSDPLRVRILYILKRHPLCVCLIKEITSVPDSKLSYHLGVLKEEGLIAGKQEGNWIIYRATDLANEMLEMCSGTVE